MRIFSSRSVLSVALACTLATPVVAEAATIHTAATTSLRGATPMSSALFTALNASALSPAAAAAKKPTLKYKSRGPAVVYVQQVLKVKPATGYFGPLTLAAVKKYQKAHKLQPSGTVGPLTWALLLAEKPSTPTTPTTPDPDATVAKRPTLRLGSRSSAVAYVQKYLSVTPATGYFGTLTRTAVKRYQTGMKITPSGVVGPLTWAAILAGKRPAAAAPAPEPTEDPTPTTQHNATTAQKVVAFAMAQVGERYVLGGNGPNIWDCSGLVQQAYLSVGVKLPRLASQQKNVGTRVTLAQLKPGDILYYQDGPSPRRGHISMYAGNGKVVEAANPRRGVRVRDLYEAWYAKRFVVATRIV